MLLVVGRKYLSEVAKLRRVGGVLGQQTDALLDRLNIKDPWLRYLCNLECFLLSGMTASGMVAAEFASVFGASDFFKVSEYPKGG